MISLARARAVGGRKPHTSAKPVVSRVVRVPAPLRGMFDGIEAPEGAALVIENGFVDEKGIRMRAGYRVRQVLDAPVVSMFRYKSAATEKVYAATANKLFDVTAGTVEVLTGRASGYYVTAQLGTVGQDYLYAVNGTDKAQLFDGAMWKDIDATTTPRIAGVDTATFSYVWTFKSRFFFIKKNSRTAYYLPVDSAGDGSNNIGELSLDGVFQMGGSLLFGATWSQDSGDGMDDRCVFVSDQGEVAVYQGANPASASDWSLVGLYRISRPVGPKAHVRAGGDVLVATERGLTPLSAATQKDAASMELVAVSGSVRQTWQSIASEAGAAPWELIKWERGNRLYVVAPDARGRTLVSNLNSAAWSHYSGWSPVCGVLFEGGWLFGRADGAVCEAEATGSDGGEAYVMRIAMHPLIGDSVTYAGAIRAHYHGRQDHPVELSVGRNYSLEFPAAPSPLDAPASSVSTWDVGLWDAAIWDETQGQAKTAVATSWKSVGAGGFGVSPMAQASSKSVVPPDFRLLSFDLSISTGAAL